MRRRLMRRRLMRRRTDEEEDNEATDAQNVPKEGPGQLCIKARDLQDQYLAGDSEINKERACPMLILNLG